MPKRIALLRHAKASWADGSLEDRDRPLSKRGERDAPVIAGRMVNGGGRPSLILTSTAKRARQTARFVARKIGYPVEFIQGEPDLYQAGPKTILDVIARQDKSFNDIVVCAHNPGITDLANVLCNAGIDHVPTCGIVILAAEIDDWSELGDADCTLIEFDYPKKRSPAGH